MPPTIYQIARRAGVSPATVSNILAGRFKAARSDAARRAARVRRIAAEMDYHPNAAARATRRGCFGNIAMLLSSRQGGSYLSPDLLRGIHDQLTTRTMNLIVSMLPDEQLIERWGVPSALESAMADGLLVDYTHAIPQRLIRVIRHNRLPSIWINTRLRYDCIYFNEVTAARALTRSLYQMGHRRIAYVDFSHHLDAAVIEHHSASDRCQGYRQAMRQCRLEPVVVSVRHTRQENDSRVQAAHALLSRPDRPSAVICYASSNTTFLALAATQMGLSIPRDLSLATFAGRPEDVLGIPLTHMRNDERTLGEQSVIMLLKRIKFPDQRIPATRLSATLDIGATCRAVTD